MVERISTATRYARLVTDMQTNMYNYNKLTLQLSSGKKYTNITDNPIASVNILNTNRQLGQIETFEQNVGMASAELSALDDLMDLATGYLSKAWDKAVQANTQTYGDSSLKALKVEIDEITKTMVDLANTEYDDNYIFSGANTKTVPYTMPPIIGPIFPKSIKNDKIAVAVKFNCISGLINLLSVTRSE